MCVPRALSKRLMGISFDQLKFKHCCEEEEEGLKEKELTAFEKFKMTDAYQEILKKQNVAQKAAPAQDNDQDGGQAPPNETSILGKRSNSERNDQYLNYNEMIEHLSHGNQLCKNGEHRCVLMFHKPLVYRGTAYCEGRCRGPIDVS